MYFHFEVSDCGNAHSSSGSNKAAAAVEVGAVMVVVAAVVVVVAAAEVEAVGAAAAAVAAMVVMVLRKKACPGILAGITVLGIEGLKHLKLCHLELIDIGDVPCSTGIVGIVQ